MGKTQSPCVQEDPIPQDFFNLSVPCPLKTVESIPHERSSQMSEMDPDLVGPSGMEPAGDKRVRRDIPKRLYVSPGIFSIWIYRHPVSVFVVPSDRHSNGNFIGYNTSAGQS